jgi:tetratricopeptide (TPR) repeat protein
MRSIIALSLVFFLTAPAAVNAQTAAPSAASVEPADRLQTSEERLDELFAELKRAKNEHAAERIVARIAEEWSKSGSATIDLLMQWAQEAMDGEEYAAALDFLDQVVTLAPDYAEGWNRRATLHFAMDDYGKSMADIARTLRLEPRHFGAMSGMATIFQNTGRDEAALRAYERLLEVYPMMRSAQTEVGELIDDLTGEGI